MELEPHFDTANVLGTNSGRIKAKLGLIQSGTYGEDDAMRQNANALFICISCHIIP